METDHLVLNCSLESRRHRPFDYFGTFDNPLVYTSVDAPIASRGIAQIFWRLIARRLKEPVVGSPAMRLPSCLCFGIMKKEKVVGSGDASPRHQGAAKTRYFIYFESYILPTTVALF